MIIKKKNQEQEQKTHIENKSVIKQTSDQKKVAKEVENFDNLDFSNIQFKERLERRKGDRRRGYRRIDERSLVSRAQEEAENIKLLASKEGYKAGMQEAVEDIQQLKEAICEFLDYKKEINDKISNDILDLSIEVAKKIINKEVSLGDDVLKSVVSGVFDELEAGEQKITVALNPLDVTSFREFMPEILSTKNSEAKIIVIQDDNIERGSCKVTANNGIIDASFSTQLELVQNAFKTINI